MQVSVVRFRPWAPFARSVIDITYEFSRFPNPSMEVWEFLAAFWFGQHIDRVSSKPLLIGCASVPRNFFERGRGQPCAIRGERIDLEDQRPLLHRPSCCQIPPR